MLSVSLSLDHIYHISGFRPMGKHKKKDSQLVIVTLV